MPPKINGCTMADLVKQAVQKEVTSQLNEMQELLKAALTRITSLEEEIVLCKVAPRAPSISALAFPHPHWPCHILLRRVLSEKRL